MQVNHVDDGRPVTTSPRQCTYYKYGNETKIIKANKNRHRDVCLFVKHHSEEISGHDVIGDRQARSRGREATFVAWVVLSY